MNTRQLARALGRQGGLARAKNLSASQRKKIAAKGGRMKALSAKAAARIEANFKYLKVVEELQKTPRPKAVSRVDQPLPGIYARRK